MHPFRRVRFLAPVAAAAFALPVPARADSFTFGDFSSTSGLNLSGSAATATTGDGRVLRIIPASGNQAGAAYSTSPVTLGSNATFSTQFQFRFTNPGGVDPADGITFVLAASPTGLGTPGYGMGYQGVPNSVAIEMDTYNNGTDGSLGRFAAEPNSSNHVAIDTGGSLTNTAAVNVYNNGSCGFPGGAPSQNNYAVPGCMSNGQLWTVSIAYDGARLNVSLFDPSEGAGFTALSDYAINIGSILGTNVAYVGFTGSSGSGYENEDITSWRFANTAMLPPVTTPPATSVPEPASLAVLLAGFGAVAIRRHRAGAR